MSLSRSILALSDSVLVKAAAAMEPDVLADCLRVAAANEVNATAMIPAIFGSLAPGEHGTSSKPVGAVHKTSATSTKVETPAVSKAPRGARKAAAVKPASVTVTGEKVGKAKREKAPRLGADVIAQRMDLVEAFVLANPGCQAGAVAKHVGCKSPQLATVFRALVTAGKINVTGVKNGTRYHAPVSDDDADESNVDSDEDQREAAE